MGAEGTPLPYYLASILVLLGLFGILTLTHLAKKVIAFLFFQAGTILFFLALTFRGEKAAPGPAAAGFWNPLPLSLALLLIAVSTLVGLTLLMLASHLREREGTWEEEKMNGGTAP